jgi:hypothetical protein
MSHDGHDPSLLVDQVAPKMNSTQAVATASGSPTASCRDAGRATWTR